MKDSRILFSRSIAFAFLRMQMQQSRPLHLLYPAQRPDQLHHIMSVLGTEVADIHSLEDILLIIQQRLQRIVETYNLLATLIIQQPP